MKNILFVSDLDGSFLGRGSRVVPRNLELIEKFKERGGLFTACTGRIYARLEETIPAPEKVFNVPAIMANGTCIYDFSTGKSLHDFLLDPQKTVEIMSLAHQLDSSVAARITTPDGLLANPEWKNSYVERDVSLWSTEKSGFIPIDKWALDRAVWYKAVFRGEAENILNIRPILEEKFGDVFHFTASSPKYFEMVSSGCSKAHGLAFLKAYCEEKYGHPFTTVALGDYENDKEVLEAADISFCPANAQESIKAICDYTVCQNDEGAVAEAIEIIENVQ
ncbi:MAG: HAD hydrolase family protein [Clostridia bacterium]|nr:HAD hydrolase family protein [Clostridia bacterium]